MSTLVQYFDSKRQGSQQPVYSGVLVEKRSESLPPGYELLHSNVSNCTILYCRSADIGVWPVCRSLGISHSGLYLTLFAYIGKAQFAKLANTGDVAALWELIAGVSSANATFLSVDPASQVSRKNKYRIGRILETKGMLMDLLGIDSTQFRFRRDSSADYCLAIRVPSEWCTPLQSSKVQLVTPEQRVLVRNSILHRITGDELCDACTDPDRLHTLLYRNADPNQTSSKGVTPLMHACRVGNLSAARMLLEAHAEVNARDKFGCASLSAAIVNDNVELVKLLLSYGADLHAVDLWGENALMLAVRCNRKAIVDVLLKAGAERLMRNKYGQDARAIARMQGDLELVKLVAS